MRNNQVQYRCLVRVLCHRNSSAVHVGDEACLVQVVGIVSFVYDT